MKCPYCGSEARLTDSNEVYGTSYGKMWLCSGYPDCDAYVGVHKGTRKPLGTMANALLRMWRKRAHAAFDPLWKTGKLKRGYAYEKLASALNISPMDAHIGHFDVEQCKLVVNLFKEGEEGA